MLAWTSTLKQRRSSMRVFRYFGSLPWPRVVLWCYLCWYVTLVALYFDPSVDLWLSSLGISGIIGIALVLSTATAKQRLDRWTVFRLFLMPFCVSSYAALIKGHGFVLLFSPHWTENATGAAACLGFLLIQRACAWWVGARREPQS